MVASAIASVVALAASYAFLVAARQRERAKTNIERLDQTFSANSTIERPLLNTGFHMPAARFAVRVRNNVPVGADLGNGLIAYAVNTCTGGDGGSPLCLLAGTDVLEIIEGLPMGMARVSGPTVVGSTVELTLQPGFPALVPDVGGQYFFVFANDQGQNCMGRGGLRPPGDNPNYLTVTLVDRDYNDISPTSYSTTSSAPYNYVCPAKDMAVGVASMDGGIDNLGFSRRRYMVLHDAAGNFGLYTQSGSPWSNPTPVSLGVDNLQLVPVAMALDAGMGATWTQKCQGALCDCNIDGADCQMGANVPTDPDVEFVTTNRVVGVRLLMTSRGTGARNAGASTDGGPRLADESITVLGLPDLVERTGYAQTVMFRNLSQVQP